MSESPQLKQAIDLLGRDPLPADAEIQLEQLEAAAPAREAPMFADLWEALTVNRPLPADQQR